MNTTLAKLRLVRIVGLAAGAVAVAGAAVLVTASAADLNAGTRSSTPAGASIEQAATPAAVCDAFLTHLATDLGKSLGKTASKAQMSSAIQQAIAETLADEVKNGSLKQAQADAIKQKLTSQSTCALAGIGKTAVPGARVKAGVFKQLVLSAEAAALGVSDATLKADLASGKTISQLAVAGTTEDQFRATLIAKLTPMLDVAITNKQLTTAQKAGILKSLQTGPVPSWSKPALHKPVAPAAA